MTLLVTLSVIDANVRRTISASLPAKAPNLFFLDIPSADAGRFGQAISWWCASASRAEAPPVPAKLALVRPVTP